MPVEALPELPVECPPPQFFYIDIGNICNLRCPYCPTGNGVAPASGKGLMSRETFEVVLDRIAPYARFVCLFNWGEPFLHKDLLDMIRAFSARGIPTHLDSNLSVRAFSEGESEAICQSGLFSLFGSIDGATQESYEKYRVGGRLERALDNLRQLLAARDRLGSETPGLMWLFHLNRYNEHEVELARGIAAEIGVDIWFKLLSAPPSFQTRFQRDPWPITKPPDSRIKWLPHQVNENLAPIQLHPLLHPACRQPFTTAVINWNADLYPCCVVTGERFILGNLLRQTLEEAWNGPPMRACRTFLRGFGPAQGGGSICENVCTAVPSHA
jgi:MoaA/NifB/PqqE/SkfB family radical SAM enzyme